MELLKENSLAKTFYSCLTGSRIHASAPELAASFDYLYDEYTAQKIKLSIEDFFSKCE